MKINKHDLAKSKNKLLQFYRSLTDSLTILTKKDKQTYTLKLVIVNSKYNLKLKDYINKRLIALLSPCQLIRCDTKHFKPIFSVYSRLYGESAPLYYSKVIRKKGSEVDFDTLINKPKWNEAWVKKVILVNPGKQGDSSYSASGFVEPLTWLYKNNIIKAPSIKSLKADKNVDVDTTSKEKNEVIDLVKHSCNAIGFIGSDDPIDSSVEAIKDLDIIPHGQICLSETFDLGEKKMIKTWFCNHFNSTLPDTGKYRDIASYQGFDTVDSNAVTSEETESNYNTLRKDMDEIDKNIDVVDVSKEGKNILLTILGVGIILFLFVGVMINIINFDDKKNKPESNKRDDKKRSKINDRVESEKSNNINDTPDLEKPSTSEKPIITFIKLVIPILIIDFVRTYFEMNYWTKDEITRTIAVSMIAIVLTLGVELLENYISTKLLKSRLGKILQNAANDLLK